MSGFFASRVWLANIIENLSEMRFLLAGAAVCLLAACGSGGGSGGARLASEEGAAPSASFTSVSPPSLSLSASPATVAPGESSVLTWDSSAADECTASGAWAGSRAVSGSEAVSNLTETQVYSLSCSGSGGSTVRDVQITVEQSDGIVVTASHPPASAPLLSLSASPATIAAGESSTLSWGSTGASECTASGAWGGSRPTSGSEALSNVTETRVYSLSCTAVAVRRFAMFRLRWNNSAKLLCLYKQALQKFVLVLRLI